MLFRNSLSGASSATYVGAGSAHSQTCPLHKIFAGVFCATYALCNGCSYLEETNILLNEELFI